MVIQSHHAYRKKSLIQSFKNLDSNYLHISYASNMPPLNGKMAPFIRQVDEFTIATHDEAAADEIIRNINEDLCLPICNLGIINRG
jgi:hypothetical protein